MIKKINSVLSFVAPVRVPWSKGQLSALEDRKSVYYASLIRKIKMNLELAEKTYNELIDIYNFSNETENDHDLKVLIKHTKKSIEVYNNQLNEVNEWIKEVDIKIQEGLTDYSFFSHGLNDLNVKPFRIIDTENIRKKFNAYM